MTDECSHVNATWICRPYHNGPLGRPQPFSTIHGEWGPPIPKISTIDWELYTVCLVLSDILISAVSVRIPLELRIEFDPLTNAVFSSFLLKPPSNGCASGFFHRHSGSRC